MTKYPFEVEFTCIQNEKMRDDTLDMGVTPGWTDLMFFYTESGITHILFLELKSKKGKLRKSQIEFINKQRGRNVTQAVAYGLIEAKETMIDWLGGLNALTSEQLADCH